MLEIDLGKEHAGLLGSTFTGKLNLAGSRAG
jgi:hypothetical protein